MSIRQLRLVMPGVQCNMNCAYCVSGHSSVTRPDGKPFAIDEEKILAAVGEATLSSVSIWGGEPYANFSRFKAAVEFCGRAFPGVPILVISNGTAFTRDKIEFTKKHKLSVTLSHDALQQRRRGADYLADPLTVELLKELDGLAFNTVIHNYNCDFPAIFRYFEKTEDLLGKDIAWMFELFQLPSPQLTDFLPRGQNLLRLAASIDFLLDEFTKGHRFAYSAVHRILRGMAGLIDRGGKAATRCGAQHRLTVTTDGRTAFCQVRAELGLFAPPDLALPPRCAECSAARFCAGICPSLTDAYRQKMCVVYKLFYDKLHRYLLKLPAIVAPAAFDGPGSAAAEP